LLLLLIRHAKSDWSGSGKIDDHERPLSARGRKAAPKIGAYMHEKHYEPALILCSTAVRAKQTLELIVPELGKTPKLRYERELYLAEWPNLLQHIQKAPALSPLCVMGHNPGMEQLAIALALQPATVAQKGRVERLAEKFPTGALAVFDFAVKDWAEAKPGLGTLIDFMRPKDLKPENGEDE
jgi:phosphohistidine phosphatase